eukprot:69326_1
MSTRHDSHPSFFIRFIVITCCVLLYGCAMWLRSSFMPVLEALEQEFTVTKQDLSKLASAFFFAYTPVQIPSGLLLQVISSELALIVPTLISGLCSLLIYAAPSFQALIAIRVLLGVSAATCWLGTLSIIQQYFSLYDVPFYAGVALFIGQSGPVLAILQTHLLESGGGWRRPFLWMAILIEILCFILFIAYFMDRKSIIKPLTMQNGELQTNTHTMSTWKSWLLPRPAVIKAYSTRSITDEEMATADACVGDIEYSLYQRTIMTISNPYNYLFALIHSCCCIPQAILGAQWLKQYLQDKFSESSGSTLVIKPRTAATIAICTNIGGAVSALLFGYIGKRYHTSNPYIYRQLCCFGFVLWSSCLFVIYLPAEWHAYWDLFVLVFMAGCGMGAVSIIFAGIRMVNDKTKSADLASGLVSSICMGVVYASYEITGILFSRVHSDEDKEQVYNTVFYVVVLSIVIGFVASFFIPKNK